MLVYSFKEGALPRELLNKLAVMHFGLMF